jgi:5-formyltetrahydrofolate cyclo-ligase
MRGLRTTTPLSVIDAKSREIVKKIAYMPEIAQARGVALFWPMVERHEVDLRPLDALLREKGKRVAYASIDQETRQMSFRWVDDVAALATPLARTMASTRLSFLHSPSIRRGFVSATERAFMIARSRAFEATRRAWPPSALPSNFST